MRNISFSLTEAQFRNHTKFVTRRLGWENLHAGDRLMAVRKAMGLRRGEHPVALGEIVVVSARREPLSAILQEADGPAKEGFPDMTGEQFVDFFCKHMKCDPLQEVTRIEFVHVLTAQLERERLYARSGHSCMASLLIEIVTRYDARFGSYTNREAGEIANSRWESLVSELPDRARKILAALPCPEPLEVQA